MKIKINRTHPDAMIPKFMSKGAAGMDLTSVEDVDILPGQTSVVSTGLAFELPLGIEIQVRSRSGLAAKYGVFVTNSPGTIDSDYRGIVKVILTNNGAYTFKVLKGDRIAQAVFSKYEIVELEERGPLSETERGIGGFGSTGVK
jgi:dUTP pyrophosphatase